MQSLKQGAALKGGEWCAFVSKRRRSGPTWSALEAAPRAASYLNFIISTADFSAYIRAAMSHGVG